MLTIWEYMNRQKVSQRNKIALLTLLTFAALC